MLRILRSGRCRIHFTRTSVSALSIFASHSALAEDNLAMTAGLGLAIQSDGNYSPLADVSLRSGRWGFTTNISGYSESKTTTTHLLAGILYELPLTSEGRLRAEFGLGALLEQTTVSQSTERMITYSIPIGLQWSFLKIGSVTLDASWKSWVFGSHPYVPPTVILSHDRFTTLVVSAGVAL